MTVCPKHRYELTTQYVAPKKNNLDWKNNTDSVSNSHDFYFSNKNALELLKEKYGKLRTKVQKEIELKPKYQIAH